MDKELACRLQAEEEAVEEVRQARDVATLEVVMEASGLLTHSQLEDLGAYAGQRHPKVTGPNHPPITAAVQPPMVVV